MICHECTRPCPLDPEQRPGPQPSRLERAERLDRHLAPGDESSVRRLFRGFDTPALWGGRAAWPRLEVEEGDTEYRVTAELPGLDEKDVEVLVHEGVLVLRGEKRVENEDRARAYIERAYGRFERRIALEGADEANTQATFRNGVLAVTVPKSARNRERVKRIPINQSATTH